MSEQTGQDLNVKVSFEAVIPAAPGPDGQLWPYDFKANPHLRMAMVQKIENNIRQFGSIEKFAERFQAELQERFDAATNAVQVYSMRKAQMEFLAEWMKENATVKDASLDREA